MVASSEKPSNVQVAPVVDNVETKSRASGQPLFFRLVSAAVLIPVVLVAVHFGGRFFAALVAFASIVMIFEWSRMVERKECSSSFYALSFGATAAMFAASMGAYLLAFGFCLIGGLGAFIFASGGPLQRLWPAIGAAYVLVPSVALMWLRLETLHGRELTFMLFFIVWAADTGAFIFGKSIGGPKISYALSPSKTWAGIGGGVFGGALIAALTAVLFFGIAAGTTFILFGAILGATSVAGDLAESAIKRNFGLKDISGFIPGHGGALDRMDGMIFSTMAMTSAYFLYMVAANGQG